MKLYLILTKLQGKLRKLYTHLFPTLFLSKEKMAETIQETRKELMPLTE